MQHYVIKFVSDLQEVGGFSPGTPVSSTNKTDNRNIKWLTMFFKTRGLFSVISLSISMLFWLWFSTTVGEGRLWEHLRIYSGKYLFNKSKFSLEIFLTSTSYNQSSKLGEYLSIYSFILAKYPITLNIEILP
jgi:hypothetical protein